MSKRNLHKLEQVTLAHDWSIGRNPADSKQQHGIEGGLQSNTPLLHTSDPDYVALRRKHKQPKRTGLQGEYTA